MITPPPPPPPAPYVAPDLRMIQGARGSVLQLLVNRRGNVLDAFLDTSIWMAADNAPLEVRAQRDADGGTSYSQAFYVDGDHGDGGVDAVMSAQLRSVPGFADKPLGTMRRFVRIELLRRNGRLLWSGTVDTCLRSNLGRLDVPESPADRTYPGIECDTGDVFTMGRVVGLDRGWAVRLPLEIPRLGLRAGRYQLRVTINPNGDLVDSSIANNTVTTSLKVRRTSVRAERRHDDDEPEKGEEFKLLRPTTEGVPKVMWRAGTPTAAPTDVDVPDLQSAPAFGIYTEAGPKRDLLAFSALTWNAGPGKLEVEAFRSGGSVLRAYQVFYDGTTRAARQQRGAVIWHNASSHQHFHFQSFARYQLLDRAGRVVRDSGKNSWCIVDTNVVDNSLPGVQPIPAQLYSLNDSCGSEPGALWARLSMSVGAGDLYDQSRAGQAFDITRLRNGLYRVRVTANPEAILAEGNYTNNESLRTVRIGGTRRHRTARVSDHPLINAEFENDIGGIDDFKGE